MLRLLTTFQQFHFIWIFIWVNVFQFFFSFSKLKTSWMNSWMIWIAVTRAGVTWKFSLIHIQKTIFKQFSIITIKEDWNVILNEEFTIELFYGLATPRLPLWFMWCWKHRQTLTKDQPKYRKHEELYITKKQKQKNFFCFKHTKYSFKTTLFHRCWQSLKILFPFEKKT